jgi:hypothetical protein
MLTLARIGAAGGAPLSDLAWAGAVGTALTALVLWIATAHRAGRISWLQSAADRVGAATGMPGWSTFPVFFSAGSLLVACFGFYWDVAKHIDTGRDPGPFGTAAHYPILIGLVGITIAGLLAIVLGTGKDDVPTSVRLSEGWRAPLGGILIFLCGGLALTGFPLDDVWHTLFGQDVTLWGPTHILMVGGASLSTLGTWVLTIEGKRVSGGRPPAWVAPLGARVAAGGKVPLLPSALTFGWVRRLVVRATEELPARILHGSEVFAAGGLLIGLSTLQGEFDYAVPQFQLVYQPVMIAFAAGLGLVAARIRIGRGAALGAALFYSIVFGLMSLAIGPGFGLSTLHFPLYLAEAALVEVVALVPIWQARRHTFGFGVVAGLLAGTVGVAVEWGWSHVWMPFPWTTSMLGQTAVLAPLAGLAGGVLGSYLGAALNAGHGLPAHEGAIVRGPRWALPAAGLTIAACIAYPLPMDAGPPGSVTASLSSVPGSGVSTAAAARSPEASRAVQGMFTFSPPSAADHAQWVQIIDWQGGGLVIDRLRRVSEGVYATTRPIPVGGKWKAILRVANGRSLRGVPVYLPNDPAIPAVGVPASAHFTRPFEREKRILQREAVGGPAALETIAYLLLVLIVAGWLGSIVLGLRHMGLAGAVQPDGSGKGSGTRGRRPGRRHGVPRALGGGV